MGPVIQGTEKRNFENGSRMGTKLEVRDALQNVCTKHEVNVIIFNLDLGGSVVKVQKVEYRPTLTCFGQPLVLSYYCGCFVRIKLA